MGIWLIIVYCFFSQLEINDKDYLKSIFNFSKFMTDRMIMELRQPLDISDWTMYSQATTINAFYLPTVNSIGM